MPQPRKHHNHAARQAAYRKRQEQTRRSALSVRGLVPLPAIATIPGHARWNQAIAHAAYLMNVVVDEMQGYFDDRSEVWQDGERAEELRERIDEVQGIIDALNALL